MNKIIRRNKGFTLVECIIAVAVFGLLSLIVFMILTNASVRATRASESEENLAQLIENVVGDETYKKFDSTSKNLTLLIDNSSSDYFAVSYNVISGYKNFIECPSCGHQTNFTEFMSSTPANGSSMTPIDAQNFDVATCYFVCPKCYDSVNFNLSCPDCGMTDIYNRLSSSSTSGYVFTYLKTASGGFECSVCGSSAVMAVDASGKFISEKASTDGFNVSGMVANGIRYGEPIDWTTLDRTTLCKFRSVSMSGLPEHTYDTNGNIQAVLKYKGTENSSFAGTYTLGLNVISLPTEIPSTIDYFVQVVFPSGYTIYYDETVYSNVEVTNEEIDTGDGTKTHQVMWIKRTGLGNLLNDIQFTLVSHESGYSFEYDYNRDFTDSSQINDTYQGLFRWFGFNYVSLDKPRTSDGYLTAASSGTLPIAN